MSVHVNPGALDRMLAERGVDYADLARAKRLGSASIARLRRGDSAGKRVLRKVAEFVDETPVLPSLRELIA